MKRIALLLYFVSFCFLSCQSQANEKQPGNMPAAANNFLQNLTSQQIEKAQFLFDDQERYNWHFVPRDRKAFL